MLENIIQALAGLFIRQCMIKCMRRGFRTLLQVHDEDVFVVPEADADRAERVFLDVMSTPPEWAPDLPVDSECGRGANYLKAK